jgi:hypothetical protein
MVLLKSKKIGDMQNKIKQRIRKGPAILWNEIKKYIKRLRNW